MSFYFAIIGTKDNPLFTLEFGTSRSGGDGTPRFRDDARQTNPFVVHAALDVVEELQWSSGAMYLKTVDRFHSSHVSCFLTGTNVRFLLLHNPDATAHPPSSSGGGSGARPMSSQSNASAAAAARAGGANANTALHPPNPASEEAIRLFFAEVYELWCKTCMNPFFRIDMEIRSPVFRQRVHAAARRYL